MEIIKTKIKVGAEKSFSVLHLSDTHLALCDERNDERKKILSENRFAIHYRAESVLEEATRYASEINAAIIHTGDLSDFVSEANLDRAERFVTENDVLFAAGNHEYSLYVGEAWEDAAYRNQSLDRVQSAYKNNIRFASKIINGVNFVAIDEGYYNFEPEQFEGLKAEVKKGYPIVLCMHVPLYDKVLYEKSRSIRKPEDPAYLIGVPEELMEYYSEYRYRQQKADELTLEVVDYIKNQPLIKAVLAGHLHIDFESNLTDNIKQYLTACTSIRQIDFE